MRLLVLGGTAWLGREVATQAVARGDEVTCLARGTSGAVAEGARLVVADRDEPGAYDALTGDWDAVIDVARQPGQVRGALAALAPRTTRWIFVSSSSVYADHATIGTDESAELLPGLEGDVMESMESYGEAKVACERLVRSRIDDHLIVRSGLIGGDGDGSGRSGYWPARFSRPSNPEGRVLVPEVLDQPTQVLDARDLAAWLLHGTAVGTLNAAGPTTTIAEHLAVAQQLAGFTGELVLASERWLESHGVESWMGERSLPLWLERGWTGLGAHDASAARAAGLHARPLAQTLAAARDFELARGEVGAHGAGLTDEVERELLAELANSPRAAGVAT